MQTIKARFKRSLVSMMAGLACLAGAMIGPAMAADIKAAKDIRIVFVTHGQANDVYWSVVKAGVEAGMKLTGTQVEYQAPETFDVVRMARMIEAATASRPDGLVVSIPDANALKEPIMAAKAAGIPVVVIDSGLDQVAEWGLDLYIGGGSEYDNGVKAGQMLGKEGVKKGICVNHEVGNVSLDQRCEGFAKGLGETGGTSEVVAVQMDPTDATRRVEAFLTAHPDTSGILTLGPTVGVPILKMLGERGMAGKFKFGTFDLSPEVLEAVDKGDMLFAIDSQQFLMGYYPVVFLMAKAQYKTFPTGPVWTGPAFVTKADANAVLDLSKAGIR